MSIRYQSQNQAATFLEFLWEMYASPFSEMEIAKRTRIVNERIPAKEDVQHEIHERDKQ